MLQRLLSKLSAFFVLYVKAPKRWRWPEKCDVLLFDKSGLEALAPYLQDYSLFVLCTRGEEVNIPCLVSAFFSSSFWRGKVGEAYFNKVVKSVSPKLAVTFIDNNSAFYRISSDYPALSSVFIQNGFRGLSGDVFACLKQNKNFLVDYMLVFNPHIGKKYSGYIRGNVIPIGSLKNNHYAGIAQNATIVHPVLFVSQYRPKKNVSMYVDAKGKRVMWDAFYEHDKRVVSWLNEWCSERGKTLSVCGGHKGYSMEESSWYESILGRRGESWDYYCRDDIFDSYKLIQRAEIVVAIDSTLGYEAFATGKKTAMLTGRGALLDDPGLTFAWPAEYPDSGPFWSNHSNKDEFLRIMNYLHSVSDDEWAQVNERYRDDIMAYDPGNTKLTQVLDDLLQKS